MVNFPLSRFWAKYLYILIVFLFTNGCTALVDDKSYVSAFNPPTYLYDSGILKLEHTLTMPSGDGAHEMFFSHNGRYLVTTSSYSLHYNIWDMDTGEIAFQVDKYSPGYLKLFGPRRLISDIFSDYREAMFLPDDSALLLPKKEKKLPPPGVTNIAPVSDGYFADELYSYYYLDMADPGILRPALPASLRSKYLLDNAVGSFSPDGKYFAQAGRTTTVRSTGHPDNKEGYAIYGKDSLLKLYRTSDWKLVADVKKGFASDIIRFTPDSKYVVDYERIGDDDGIKPYKWELAHGNPYRKYKHNGIVEKEDYHSNLEKYEYPEIRFWSVPDLKLEKTIDNVFRGRIGLSRKNPRYLSISQDGRMVAVQGADDDRTESELLGSKGFVRVFSIDSGKMICEIKEFVGNVDFSHDNRYLLVESGLGDKAVTAVTVYSTKDWQVKERVQFRKNAIALNHARTFNTRKNLFAFANGNIIYIWKIIEK